MSAYLFAVAGTVIVASIVSAIAPDGKISSMVKSVAKLVCLIVIAEPIANFALSFKTGKETTLFDKNYFSRSVINTDDDFIKYSCELRIEEAEQRLKSEIFDLYGVQAEVTFDWVWQNDGKDNYKDNSKIKIQLLVLKMPPQTKEELKSLIKSELEEKYGTKVQISQSIL